MEFDENIFKSAPAFRLLLFSIFGYFISIILLDDFDFLINAALIFVISGILFYFKLKTLLYYILAISFGICFSFYSKDIKLQLPEKLVPIVGAEFDGEVDQILGKSDKSIRIIASGTLDSKILKPVQCKILLNISGRDSSKFDRILPGMSFHSNLKIRQARTKQIEEDFPEESFLAGIDAAWIGSSKIENFSIKNDAYGLKLISFMFIKSLSNQIDTLFQSKFSSIVKALLLGDQSGISKDQREQFSLTGTAHILSLSGIHIGIISIIIYLLLGFIENRWVKFTIFSAIILAFVFVTGLLPPAIRAASMGILFLLGITIQRKANSLNILSVVVIISLLIFPEWIYSIGFQFSALSMFGIALLYKPFNKFFRLIFKKDYWIFRQLSASFAMTFSASLIISPIVAYYFGIASLISPLTNIPIVFLMNLALIYALISLLISYIYMPLAILFSTSASLCIDMSFYINNIAVNLPYSFIKSTDLSLISVITSITLLYILLAVSYKQFVFRIIISIILFSIINSNYRNKRNEDQIQLISRDNFAVAKVKLNPNKSLFAIFDRKPSMYPYKDVNLEKHILNCKDTLILAVSGNCGIKLHDDIKNLRKITYIEMDFELQNKIEKLIYNGNKICRYNLMRKDEY